MLSGRRRHPLKFTLLALLGSPLLLKLVTRVRSACVRASVVWGERHYLGFLMAAIVA
ncbi:MAG: hypothetical protein QNJ54_30010 [Prochloraceae cyanobacterium]|nr:hypothetical protein [Prochloraceae cyanobacterium]